jgi:hypothetical protein
VVGVVGVPAVTVPFVSTMLCVVDMTRVLDVLGLVNAHWMVHVHRMVHVRCIVHVLGRDSVPAAPVIVAHVAPLGSSLATLYP